MRAVAALVVGAWVAAAHPLGAQDAAAATSVSVTALPTSTLTFRGSTTIGAGWHCAATNIKATAEVGAATRVLSLEAIRSVFVNVPVWTLKCQSGAMERAMRKALRADKDPSSAIVGRFSAHVARVAVESDTSTSPHLDGALTVAGVERQVRLDLLLTREGRDTIHVASSLPLKLSSFSIARPRVLFGAVRARDAITVDVELRFTSTLPGPR